jgi:hypothetical protein
VRLWVEAMFDALCGEFSERIRKLSNGELQCLPYSRALLDFFNTTDKTAKPLVARAVVFGQETGINWSELLHSVPELSKQLFFGATESTRANGVLSLEISPAGSASAKTVNVAYRTLGFTHGTAELGSYHHNGTWNGHLVVCVDNTLIDLTIGQINDVKFGINFSPPYVTIETDEGFLSGRSPLIGIHDDMLVMYRAYPNERTFEQSNSWGKDHQFRQQLLEFGMEFAESAAGMANLTFPDKNFAATGQIPIQNRLITVLPLSPKELRKKKKQKLQKRKGKRK